MKKVAAIIVAAVLLVGAAATFGATFRRDYQGTGGCPRFVAPHSFAQCAYHSHVRAFEANMSGPHTVILAWIGRSCGAGRCTARLPRDVNTRHILLYNDANYVEVDYGTYLWP